MRERSEAVPYKDLRFPFTTQSGRVVYYRTISPTIEQLVQSGLAAALDINMLEMIGGQRIIEDALRPGKGQSRSDRVAAAAQGMAASKDAAFTMQRLQYGKSLVIFGLALVDDTLELSTTTPKRPMRMDANGWLKYSEDIEDEIAEQQWLTQQDCAEIARLASARDREAVTDEKND